jgi:hypothetical protein
VSSVDLKVPKVALDAVTGVAIIAADVYDDPVKIQTNLAREWHVARPHRVSLKN